MTATLKVTEIKKHYAGVRALESVTFSVPAGRVVALVGENGAGKSTLVKILAGVERPDSGTISINGVSQTISSPMSAAALGIQVVYQDLALCDELDIVQNMFLGRERTSSAWLLRRLNRIEMEREAAEALNRFSRRTWVLNRTVRQLSGGQRQALAICRAMLEDPAILILDEPTAALGVAETLEVVELIKELSARGKTVLMVSHDLQQVREVADHTVVLRHGHVVAEWERGKYDGDDLVAAITGSRHSL
jgi:D-xylose transport system ATP-binding protein